MVPLFQSSLSPTLNFRRCAICKSQKAPRQFRFLPREAFNSNRKNKLSIHDYYQTLFKFHNLDGAVHCFHASCIDRWMEKFSYCPVCKKSAEEVSTSEWSSQEDEIKIQETMAAPEELEISDMSEGEPFQDLQEEEYGQHNELELEWDSPTIEKGAQQKLSPVEQFNLLDEELQLPLLPSQKKRIWKIALRWLCMDILCCYRKFH